MAVIDNLAIVAALLVGDTGTIQQKGSALEAVVQSTFCEIDGVRCLKVRAVDLDGASEIDLLLHNRRTVGALDFLPELLLVECKNWTAPVNTATLRSFTSKLAESRLEVGILVASSGVTGDPDEQTACYAHLRRQFDQNRLKVIILTRDELQALTSTEAFCELLMDKYASFIMNLEFL
jgi:Restriction endonuclease